MPKTGALVMIDEICDVLAIWTVCIYVIVRIIQSIGSFSTSVKAARGVVYSRMCGHRRSIYEEHCFGSCVRTSNDPVDGYTGQQISVTYGDLFPSLLSDRNGQPG